MSTINWQEKGFQSWPGVTGLELLIYGPIGMGGGEGSVDANVVVRALQEYRGELIRLYINSPGGVVYDGLAIYNALKRHPARKEVQIDGICASAATIIAMAGDRISAADNAMIMVHAVWNTISGDAEELRREAGVLEDLTETLVQLYVQRTGRDPALVRGWVASETWFTAAEALAAGLIDQVLRPSRAVAKWEVAQFGLPSLPARGPAAPAAGEPQAVAAAVEASLAAVRTVLEEFSRGLENRLIEVLETTLLADRRAAYLADFGAAADGGEAGPADRPDPAAGADLDGSALSELRGQLAKLEKLLTDKERR